MRWLILVTIMLLTFNELGALEEPFDITLSVVGYRHDSLTTVANGMGANSKFRDQLKTVDIDIWQYGFKARSNLAGLLFYTEGLLQEHVYVRGSAYRGFMKGGNFKEEIDNRVGRKGVIHNGRTLDADIGLGISIPVCCWLNIGPTAGYAYDKQKIKLHRINHHNLSPEDSSLESSSSTHSSRSSSKHSSRSSRTRTSSSSRTSRESSSETRRSSRSSRSSTRSSLRHISSFFDRRNEESFLERRHRFKRRHQRSEESFSTGRRRSIERSFERSSDSSTSSSSGHHPKRGHLNYTTKWEGPFVGLDLAGDFCCIRFLAGYEYHWPQWFGYWNLKSLRTASDRRRSSSARGQIGYLDLRVSYSESFYLGMGLRYQNWKANRGHLTPSRDSSNGEERISRASWHSWGVSFDVSFRF